MDFDNFFFSPVFGLKKTEFIEKSVFLLSGRVGGGGFTLPTPLVVQPLKKKKFMCVFP